MNAIITNVFHTLKEIIKINLFSISDNNLQKKHLSRFYKFCFFHCIFKYKKKIVVEAWAVVLQPPKMNKLMGI